MPKISVERRRFSGKICAPLVTAVRNLLHIFCRVLPRASKASFLVVCHLLATTAFSATLVWDANEDSVTEGYRVIARTGVETLSFDVGSSNRLALDFAKPGRLYLFHVVAYSYDRIESDPSNLLEYDVPIPFGWPTLLTQPLSLALGEGAPAFFVVQTAGINIRFQWLKNGQEIPGATNIFLSIPSVTPAHVGHYSVRVANILGEIESEAAELSLLLPPRITAQSRAVRVREGDPLLLSAEADGTAPLIYRWTKGSEIVQEGEQPRLFLMASKVTDAGFYQVEVSNEFGSAVSDLIEVVVDPVQPPSIRIQRSESELVLVIQGYPSAIYMIETHSTLAESTWIPIAGVETDEQGHAVYPLRPDQGMAQLFRIFELGN